MFGQKIIHLVGLAIISILSLVTIWSTTPSLFFDQLAFLTFGAIVMLLIRKTDRVWWYSLSPLAYLLCVVLLIITLIFARETRGSTRWIAFGFFTFQTSECIKPLLLVCSADYLSKNDTTKAANLFKNFGLIAIPAALIFFQPDLGSTLVLLFISLAMLLANGINTKAGIVILLSGLLVLGVGSRFAKDYQIKRLTSFANPYADPKGAGYHVIQSIIAVGSGEVFGKGVKLGTQSHLNFLPERHTDFVFASFVEEFGLVGMVILFSAYFVYMNSLLIVSKNLKNKNDYLLAIGIFSAFIFQFTVNIGMNMGIMPVTGITLPLFSYGGSSLISFLMIVGLSLKLLDLSTPKPV